MISIRLRDLRFNETAALHPRVLLYNRYKVTCLRLDRVLPPP